MQWGRVLHGLRSTLDFFSIGQLLTTLFDPFRQISANDSGDGSLGSGLRAFGDKLISRVIGAIIRTITIVTGLIAIFFQALYMLITLILWWVIPVFPVVALILFAIGWVPVWM